MQLKSLLSGIVGLSVATSVAGAQATTKAPTKAPTVTSAATPAAAGYKKELPAKLVAKAKIAETAAAATALAKVPGGKIESVELEEEGGQLIYSYDIKIAGKKGVEEVAVDAMTGVAGKVEHEDPATEKKEAEDDKKAAKKPAAPAVKKP